MMNLMLACARRRTHTHMHTYTHAHVHTCTRAHTHTYIHACMRRYAMSLGTFSPGGGQLCVESANGRDLFVTDTRNRMAKVDGRFIHWVRGYTGERYSIIFYSACEVGREPPLGATRTPKTVPAFLDWMPQPAEKVE